MHFPSSLYGACLIHGLAFSLLDLVMHSVLRVDMFLQSLEVQTMLSLLVSLLVTIPLCYAPAAFVTFLVRERACKSKRVSHAFSRTAESLVYTRYHVISCLVTRR